MKRSMILVVAIMVASCSGEQETPAEKPSVAVPDVPIREHMETVIAPATDTIWGINDPQTDEEWQVVDDAAVAIIEAMTGMKEGGTGPNNVAWAANADWDNYMDIVIAAAQMTREAVADRNVDGVYAAGDVLYPPCEGCHLKFHPEVAGQ
jgi:hypothetical protein